MTLNSKQVIYHLDKWNYRLDQKVTRLNWYGSIYRLTYYFNQVANVVLTALLVPLVTYVATHSNQADEVLYEIASIALLTCQILLAVIFVLNKLIKPNKNAETALLSAHKYEELSREMDIMIDVFKNNVTDNSLNVEYLIMLRYYSAREQLILDWEPKIFFHHLFTKKKPTDGFGKIIMDEINSEDSILMGLLEKMELENMNVSIN